MGMENKTSMNRADVAFLFYGGMAFMGMMLLRAVDKHYEKKRDLLRNYLAVAISFLLSQSICVTVREGGITATGCFLTGFQCLLFWAALMDLRECLVYRYVWYLSLALGGVQALFISVCANRQGNSYQSWFIFTALQFVFFSKMYGRADCYAFTCCSLILHNLGGDMQDDCLMMLSAILLLGLVQLWKGNVNRHGNLKEKKAFIPYITVAYFVKMVFL